MPTFTFDFKHNLNLKEEFLNKKKLPISIGSDPEFVFASPFDNSPIPADNLIRNLDNSRFGHDGHSATGEIRPMESDDPLIHVNNIKKIFLTTKARKEHIFSYDFYSSCSYDPIGGHIHFGHPLLLDTNNYHPGLAVKIYELQKNFINCLDSYISFLLMFVEVPEHAMRRKSSSYGKLSSTRYQDWGLEYRTPPSWLATENLTKSVMCLSHIIAEEVIHKDFYQKNPISKWENFNELYRRHKTDLLYKLFPQTRYEIKHNFSLYPKYKDEIDYLLYHASKQNHILATEIKEGWNIPMVVMKNIMNLTIKELIQKMSLLIPLEKNIERESNNRFIEYGSTDFMIPRIANNINICLESVLPSGTLQKFSKIKKNKSIYIYAIREERGNIINIELNPEFISSQKIKRLQKILTFILRKFGDYGSKTIIKKLPQYIAKYNLNTFCGYIRSENERSANQIIGSYYMPHPNTLTQNITENTSGPPIIPTKTKKREVIENTYLARVGISRYIRSQHNYLAEAILFTILIYLNDSLYQSYYFDRKTNKKRSYPIMPNLLLSNFEKNMIKIQKLKLGGIDVDGPEMDYILPTRTR